MWGEADEVIIGLRLYSLGPSNSLEIISSSQPRQGRESRQESDSGWTQALGSASQALMTH